MFQHPNLIDLGTFEKEAAPDWRIEGAKRLVRVAAALVALCGFGGMIVVLSLLLSASPHGV